MKKKRTAAVSLALALTLLAGCDGQAASGSVAAPGSVSLNPKPVSSEAESSAEEDNSPDPYSNSYRLEQMGVDVRAVLDEARREAVRTYDWSCVTWHPDDFDSFAEIAPRAALARNFDLDAYEMVLEQNGTVTFDVTPLYTGGYGFSEAKINVPLKQSPAPVEEHDLLLGSWKVYESLLDGERTQSVPGAESTLNIVAVGTSGRYAAEFTLNGLKSRTAGSTAIKDGNFNSAMYTGSTDWYLELHEEPDDGRPWYIALLDDDHLVMMQEVTYDGGSVRAAAWYWLEREDASSPELPYRVDGFSDYTDYAVLQDGGFGFERVLCLLTKEGLVEYVNLPACENFAEDSGYYVSRGPIAGISDVKCLEQNTANGDVTAITNSGERISLTPLLRNMFDTPSIPEEYQGTFSGTVIDPNTLEDTRELYLELSGDGNCTLTIIGDGLDGDYTGYAYYLGTSTAGAVYGFDLESEETGKWKFLTALDYNPNAEWLYLTSMSLNTLFTANGEVHAMTALQRTYG